MKPGFRLKLNNSIKENQDNNMGAGSQLNDL
jgi:hypothetical protein